MIKKIESILRKLTPHGPITARAMFGGYGIYFDKLIFAVLVEDKLYFRVDETNEKDFEQYRSKPLVFEGKNRPVVMSYFTLPEKVLNDPSLLPLWIKKAKDTSLRSRSKKKKKPG
jgi:DNA transformation protein and related proteins